MAPALLNRAVVLGGSVAGMLAARVLAERFASVTVVEKDPEPGGSVRKGAPQGHHTHSLLMSGKSIFADLFPGFLRELEAAGSTPLDFAGDLWHFHFGSWKLRHESGLRGTLQTRPFLELHLRRRLQAYGNVHFRYGTRVTGVVATSDRSRVRGVKLGSEEIPADLVVDATGRGSRTPRWLEELGYPPPEESRVTLRLGHSSRFFRRPGSPPGWAALLIYPRAPEELRAGLAFTVERDRWLVSLAGYMGDYPPGDEEGFLAFARGLPRSDIYDAIKHAEPLSGIEIHRFPVQVRRHYERLASFPDGLVVIGDAACSFDPLFGQGMSIAAKEAVALRDCLEREAALPARFHRRISRIVDVPWLLTSSEAFRYPQAEGAKPPGVRFLQWYAEHLFELSARDREVYRSFLDVMHLVCGLERAFRPSILLRVLKRGLAARAA